MFCIIICKIFSIMFERCIKRIEKYNKECEERDLEEALFRDNPYHVLG